MVMFHVGEHKDRETLMPYLVQIVPEGATIYSD